MSAAMCANGWWDFAPTRIVTAGETSCIVEGQQAEEASLRLDLACTAEGMEAREVWTLRFEGPDRMSVQRDAQAPVALRRCA